MLKWLFGKQADDGRSGAPPVAATLPHAFEMFSRTATLVIFDLAGLKHRVDDEVDWWADPTEEIDELHRRNALIIGLGANDWYDVHVSTEEVSSTSSFSLNFPSGRVFVGPGEEMTGGGDEPTGQHGGAIFSLEPGDYKVGITRDAQAISLNVIRAAAFSNNHFGPVTI